MIELRNIGTWTGLTIEQLVALPAEAYEQVCEGVVSGDRYFIGDRNREGD